MSISEGIFKAYDMRGLYPEEIDDEAAERIGAAWPRSWARRGSASAVTRARRPRLAAAFAAGAAAAGAATVDFGLVPTEMLYFGVASRGLDGGAMVTASHNPQQYTGVKLVREGRCRSAAMPASRSSRSAAGARELPARGAGIVRARRHLRGLRRAPARLIDVSAIRPCRSSSTRQRHGRHAGADRLRGPGARVRRDVLRARRRVPRPRAQSAAGGEPPADHRDRVRDREGRSRHRLGRRRRPLLLHRRRRRVRARRLRHRAARRGRCSRKNPGATILYDLRASRAVPDVSAANGGVPLLNRVGHAFFKQRMRREERAFGGEVSGHYYFRRLLQRRLGRSSRRC